MLERTAPGRRTRHSAVGRSIILLAALVLAGLSLFAGDLANATTESYAGTVSVPPTEPAAPSDSAQVADIHRLRTENAELQQRLEDCAAEAREIEPAFAENSALDAELTASNQQQSGAREHKGELHASELMPRERKDRLRGLETHIKELEAAISQRDAEIEALRGRLDARNSAEARLNERLEALRARLPAPEGGSLTSADARKQAQADAARLAELFRQGQGVDNPQLWRQVREAENALHRSQSLLARTNNARTVYRVRPGDTLQQVSLMFYGDPDQWARLFDANRHVVDDPNRLLPWVTLIVP